VLRARLQRLVSEWDSIQADVATTLRPSAELEAELRSANCPTRFAEIGVDTARAVRAIVLSRDIRARYTILHLASELGVLDAFAKAEVSRPPA
jgi:glycerol-1-phosphate dehydrogenase [NAD(P)+]